MGQVWKARDTRLDRIVALKVSQREFTERFEREARAISALNHPHICQLYDVGPNYLVMEFAEGEPLLSPRKPGPLPVEKALEYSRQILDALDHAHRHKITHRDLKPANIMITRQGVKLLDFGLAKVETGPLQETDETITQALTKQGQIVGTLQYMSPEQLQGKPADARSDIFSFGAVLYEMLSGKRAFEGSSVASVIAAVLERQPAPLELSPPLDRVIRACLEKDPEQRIQTAQDAKRALEWAAEPELDARKNAPSRSYLGVAVAVAAVLLVLAGLTSFGWWRATRPTDRPVMWLSVDLGPDARALRDFTAAISPDGTRLVFPIGDPGASRLALRSLGQPNATPLAGTEGGSSPFFSPDGEWVAFGAGGTLKKISIHGGPPMTLCDACGAVHGGAWGEDGFIVAALGNSSGLSRVHQNGGSLQTLTKLENGELTQRWPQILPGRKAILFSASSSQMNWEEADVEVLSLNTGQRKTVVHGGFYGRYLPSGHLVYLRGGTLYGMAFDIDRLEPAGPPATLLEDIAASEYGGGQLDFSRNGTLVYLTGNPPSEAMRKLVWIDAAGKTQPFFAPPNRFNSPALSPDGTRLALSIGAPGGSDLTVYDLEREIPTKLRTGGHVLLGPVWAPDGKHLVYGTQPSSNNGVMWIRADGGAEPQPLIRDDTHTGQVPDSVSPDGRFVLFTGPGMGAQRLTIDTTDPDHPKAGPIEPLLNTSAISSNRIVARSVGPEGFIDGRISPDGRWLAYTFAASGTVQVFVRPFANGKIAGDAASQISAAGAAYPIWSRAPGARQLLYATSEGRVMVVDYTVEGDSFHGLKPRPWTDKLIGTTAGNAPFGLNGQHPVFDLTRDGTRIIAWEPQAQPQEQPKEAKVDLHVTMLLNWFDELRRRLPPSGK